MYPSLLAEETRRAVTEYLSTTFALADDDARAALEAFLLDGTRESSAGPTCGCAPRSAGADVRSRADVLNVDALATRILGKHEAGERRTRLRSDDDPEIVAAWDAARAAGSAGSWLASFLQSEWSHVVLAQGIDDRDGYLRASRSGRGRRLSRPQRAELWSVFERFTQLLTAQDLMTFTQAASRAAVVAGSIGVVGPGHAQDLPPPAIRKAGGRGARHRVASRAKPALRLQHPRQRTPLRLVDREALRVDRPVLIGPRVAGRLPRPADVSRGRSVPPGVSSVARSHSG